MTMIKAFFRIIRWPNLLIIILTQYLMRYGLVGPMLHHLPGTYNGQPVVVPDVSLVMSDFYFFLLVFATVMLTAAGYVINDYFDTRTDMINRPHRVVVGKEIPRRKALVIHIVLNVLGVGAGIVLSWAIGLSFLGIVFILAAGLLWFYSTTYKRQFLIGNLLVAFLTALVPFMVPLFEIPLVNKQYASVMILYHATWRPIMVWSAGISLFAFLLTLIREIIKDMEDYEGDWSFGRNSMPVVAGLDTTRYIVLGIIVITILLVLWVIFFYLGDTFTIAYGLAAIVAPLIGLIIKMIKARSSGDYHKASTLTKWIMLTGLAYILVADYLFSTLIS